MAENSYDKQELSNSLGFFKFEIVEKLPDLKENANSNVVYLVPISDEKSKKFYEEWVKLNNNWVRLGTTEIDLSNYIESFVRGDTTTSSLPNTGSRIEGQVFINTGNDSAIYLQGGAIILKTNGEKSKEITLGDEALLDNSEIINLERLREELQKYVPFTKDGEIDLTFDNWDTEGNSGIYHPVKVNIGGQVLKLYRSTYTADFAIDFENDMLKLSGTNGDRQSSLNINNNVARLESHYENLSSDLYIQPGSMSLVTQGMFDDNGSINTEIYFQPNSIEIIRKTHNTPEGLNEFSIIMPNGKAVINEADFSLSDSELDEIMKEAWL